MHPLKNGFAQIKNAPANYGLVLERFFNISQYFEMWWGAFGCHVILLACGDMPAALLTLIVCVEEPEL